MSVNNPIWWEACLSVVSLRCFASSFSRTMVHSVGEPRGLSRCTNGSNAAIIIVVIIHHHPRRIVRIHPRHRSYRHQDRVVFHPWRHHYRCSQTDHHPTSLRLVRSTAMIPWPRRTRARICYLRLYRHPWEKSMIIWIRWVGGMIWLVLPVLLLPMRITFY